MTDFQRELEYYAKKLPDYKQNQRTADVITRWADGYIEAKANGNKELVECYMAALMLKNWNLVNTMFQKVQTTGMYSYDDCIDRLYECIEIACKYAAWKNPDKHTNAQACISQTVASRGTAAMFYDSNRDYAKINANTISLDTPIGDEDDGNTIADTIEDPNASNGTGIDTDSTDTIIQTYINKNKIVEAIIVDNIAHKDVFKHEKETKTYIDPATGESVKYVEHTSQFWAYQLVKELNALDDTYSKYFYSRYRIAKDKFDIALNSIKSATNQKKYKSINATISDLKTIFTV